MDLYQDMQRVLLKRADILQKVEELAERINRDYEGKELTLVGVLKGAVPFYAELLLRLKIPVMVDFMAISSYGMSSRSSGVVRILKDLEYEIADRHVLIVEDIADTGLSLKYIMENLDRRGAASVKTCTLLDKPSRRKTSITPDYIGFSIEDAFVVGYGLDYNENYRNLQDICVLKPSIYTQQD